MLKNLRAACAISILALLSGCAGRDFVRPSAELFKLGETTYAQVVKQLGEPRRSGELLKNGQTIRSITYAYAATGGDPVEKDVIPARAMGYYFHNDILVGQEFLSSFKSDHSNFDDSKVPAIVKGKTTRAEVIQLLGRPSASYIAPMVKQASGEAIGYGYQTTRGGAFSGFKLFRKSLSVSFDDKDRVSEIEYSSSGNK